MLRRDALKVIGATPLAAAPLLKGFDPSLLSVSGGGPSSRYGPTWDSIDRRPCPAWYEDAKFGIFIHWGLYSVPAYAPPRAKDETPYAEWYWHSLTEGKQNAAKGATTGDGLHTWAFHQKVYGANFPYADFAPLFKAELYDPDQWSELFVKSGARYVALTSKHHEGFALWRSAEANRAWGRPWNSVDVGPKRDLLLDLTEAGRRRGLHMGIYYSLYEWYNPLWLSDRARYVNEVFIPQFKDVVTHSKPAIIFADGEWELPSAEWRSTEVLSWLFNESPVADEVVIDDRWGKDTRHKHGGYYTTEYASGMQQSQHPWEESRGMGFSYGYNRVETLRDYHSSRQLLLMLIDIVSRGGNLLLDIGPRADGGIPVIMQERLTEIGEWLAANGEAIYATRAWGRSRQWSTGSIPKLEEKEFMSEYDITNLVDQPPSGYARVDAFFTSKGDNVYAILPRWPESQFRLEKVSASGSPQVTVLKGGQAVHSRMDGNSLVIDLSSVSGNPSAVPAPWGDLHVLKIAGLKAVAG